MEEPTTPRQMRIRRWLPYWAVFQADLNQTLRSWIYCFCVLTALLAAVGYLLYRVAVYREALIVQSAAHLMSDLLRWSIIGGVALVILVTGGTISSERGILADSVLSRGISRYQYFLGKWHARLTIVVGTFLVMGLLALVASYFCLDEDMNLAGSLTALLTVLTLLALVATCGVTVSALFNSTVLGIAILWILLYGAGFALSLLPSSYPTPDRALANMTNILRGAYNLETLARLMGWSIAGSILVALLGLGYFARRDV